MVTYMDNCSNYSVMKQFNKYQQRHKNQKAKFHRITERMHQAPSPIIPPFCHTNNGLQSSTPRLHSSCLSAIPRISSPLAPGGNTLQARPTRHPARSWSSYKMSQSLYKVALRAAMTATPQGRSVLAGHARLLLMTQKDHDEWDRYVYGTA